jgi:hypothetical protein
MLFREYAIIDLSRYKVGSFSSRKGTSGNPQLTRSCSLPPVLLGQKVLEAFGVAPVTETF